MGITLNSSAKTNRDWKTQFQFTDGDPDSDTFGQLIDLTGAFIKIVVEDSAGCEIISADTDGGAVAIVGTGIVELTVDDADMNMCPGTYQMGGFYQLSGETIDLFEGELIIGRGIGRP